MNLVKFIDLAKALEEYREVIEDFAISPINKMYELKSEYQQCLTVSMEFYIPKAAMPDVDNIHALYSKFGKFNFTYINESDFNPDLWFFRLDW